MPGSTAFNPRQGCAGDQKPSSQGISWWFWSGRSWILNMPFEFVDNDGWLCYWCHGIGQLYGLSYCENLSPGLASTTSWGCKTSEKNPRPAFLKFYRCSWKTSFCPETQKWGHFKAIKDKAISFKYIKRPSRYCLGDATGPSSTAPDTVLEALEEAATLFARQRCDAANATRQKKTEGAAVALWRLCCASWGWLKFLEFKLSWGWSMNKIMK